MGIYNEAILYNSAVAYGTEAASPIPTPSAGSTLTLEDVLSLPGYRPCARLVALSAAGDVLASWEAEEAVLLSASVTYDRTRTVRRSGEASLVNVTGSLSPQRPGDYFFTGEWFGLERGAWIGSQRFFQRQATLVVTGFRAGMTGTMSVSGEDPFSLLAQPLGDVVTIEAELPAATALRQLLEPVLGDGTDWSLDDGGRTCPLRVFLEDEDRLASAVALMADLGLEVFSDRYGRPVLQPIPDPTSAVALTVVREFRPDAESTLLGLERSGSARPYNRVIVVVETPEAAVIRATAEVTDPTSPLHKDRIGVQTAPIHRLTGGGQAEANAVAKALLVEYSLFSDTVSGNAIPDPLLDEATVVRFEEAVSGTADRYLIDRVSHPVLTGDMRIEATKLLPIFEAAA